MFPLAVRAKGLAMTNATNWAVNFGISYSIPYLVNDGPQSLGLGARVYFLWGSLSALCCVYAYFFIPETKGLTLEQVDMLFLNSTPRKSAAYRKQLLREANTSSVEDGVPSLRHSDSQTSSEPEKITEKS
ncbi:High-affinity glucose transporter SNF3 [Rhizoctonia solani AG-1 IB]|nr:High-affinity glucose transporter SNF3 [Rhizoctonia solani AG-1 IB]